MSEPRSCRPELDLSGPAGRHHSHDCVRPVVEGERLTDDRRGSAEPPFPVTIPHHDLGRTTRVLSEWVTEQCHTERREVIRRDGGREKAFRLALAANCDH